MLPVHETKHVETARDLLIGQFKNRRVVQGFLDCYVRRLQDVEDVLWDLIDARILDTAADAQLDTLGKLAGEKRLGRSDTMYRGAIRLRIRVNRSKGRITDVIDVAMLAAGASPPSVIEYQFLAFEVDLFNQIGERYVAELLSKTRAATSYGLFVASDLPIASLLQWDDAVTPGAGIETFSDAVSGTGKVCASGYGLPTDFSGIVLGTAVFNPTSLALSGWWRADYAGSPWTPTASAGASGANGNLAEATNPPSTGAAQNGKIPADFDGTNDQLANTHNCDTFVGTSGTIWGVFRADTATADAGAGSRVDNPGLVFEDGGGVTLGVGYSTSGVTALLYDGGGYKEIAVAASTTAYHFFFMRWNGSLLELGVDGGAMVTIASGSPTAPAAGALVVGKNYATAFFDGRMLEVGTSLAALSDPDRANIKSYVNATYGLAL